MKGLNRISVSQMVCGVGTPLTVDVRFYAMNAEGESAEHLATNAGNALLVIERTTWIGQDPITSVQAVTAPGYQLSALN